MSPFWWQDILPSGSSNKQWIGNPITLITVNLRPKFTDGRTFQHVRYQEDLRSRVLTIWLLFLLKTKFNTEVLHMNISVTQGQSPRQNPKFQFLPQNCPPPDKSYQKFSFLPKVWGEMTLWILNNYILDTAQTGNHVAQFREGCDPPLLQFIPYLWIPLSHPPAIPAFLEKNPKFWEKSKMVLIIGHFGPICANQNILMGRDL